MLTITLQKHINGSVLAFKGADCATIWPSFHKNKPDYRHKYVTLNCHHYKIQWVKTHTNGFYEIKG